MTSFTLNRRNLIKMLATLPCLPVCGDMPSALAAEPTLTVQSLNERLVVISGAGGNVVVFKGNSGSTLIDTGGSQHAKVLLQAVNTLLGDLPVNTVFNTHWHEDHTGNNEVFHSPATTLVAHENTRLWLGADFDVPWRQTHHNPRPSAALPERSFYTDGSMELGGETVDYIHFPQAHTDGDIGLYFRDSNILVAGGLMTDRRYPVCDIATGGWIGGLIKANETMLAITNDSTVIIPDRGAARSRADLQAQYDMLTTLYEKMKALAQQGLSGHDMLAEKLTADFDAQWGNPEEFVLETYRGMWAHTYDMGGFI